MADFNKAFSKMIENEGGYKLHTVDGDRGGMTYAGIARKFHPKWEGWPYLDQNETPPTQLVRDFYFKNYWRPIKGDEIEEQQIAFLIFDFYVNTGTPAKKLAQAAIGVAADGAFGPITIGKLNTADPEYFAMAYTLAKIARYRDICMRDRSQSKFLLGWINRSLRGL